MLFVSSTMKTRTFNKGNDVYWKGRAGNLVIVCNNVNKDFSLAKEIQGSRVNCICICILLGFDVLESDKWIDSLGRLC